MWTAETGDGAPVVHLSQLSAGGTTVLTGKRRPDQPGDALWLLLHEMPADFLQRWDAATGQHLGRHPSAGKLTSQPVYSPDGKYLAAVCERETPLNDDDGMSFLCIVEIETGKERQIALPCTMDQSEAMFGPDSSAVGVAPRGESLGELRVYDVATGAILYQQMSAGLARSTGLHVIHALTDEERVFEFWSWRDRKVVASLENIGTILDVTPDGTWLLGQKSPEGPECWQVWNLYEFKVVHELKSNLRYHRQTLLAGTPERPLAFIRGRTQHGNCIEAWDLAAGKLLGSSECKSSHTLAAASHEPRFLAAYSVPTLNIWSSRGRRGYEGMAMYGAKDMKLLWESEESENCVLAFTRDGERVIVIGTLSNAAFIRDCTTGEIRQTIPMRYMPDTGVELTLTLTPDKRHALIHQPAGRWSRNDAGKGNLLRRIMEWVRIDPASFEPKHHDATIVYDLDANRERFRLQGWNAVEAALSADGATLITVHETETTRVMHGWDVNGFKPFRYALGVPILLGGVGWSVVKAWSRWRGKARETTAGITLS
jgi:hypothetical protein